MMDAVCSAFGTGMGFWIEFKLVSREKRGKDTRGSTGIYRRGSTKGSATATIPRSTTFAHNNHPSERSRGVSVKVANA